MPAAPIRLVLAVVATVAFGFADADGCGFTPDDLKGEGEPCTRSSECEAALECRGGVCMTELPEGDAGAPFDAGTDGGSATGPDAGDGADRDAATPDADVLDAAASDGDAAIDGGGAG